MNIKVNAAVILALEQYKGKILMKDSYLYAIKNYRVETVEKQVKVSIFGSETRPVKEKHLVACNVQGYSKEGRYIGYLADTAVDIFLDQSNLYQMRQNWEDFKGMLKAFGFEITPVVAKESNPVTPETTPNPEIEEKMKCSKSPDGKHHFEFDGNTCNNCGIDIVCL